MKWSVLFLLVGCWIAQAKVIVIEKAVPELPKMEPMLELSSTADVGKARSVADVLGALKKAHKEGNRQEIAESRDWLAHHRKKDGDIWDAAVAQARAGKPEWAMRWLQEAGRHEACDVSDVEENEDFSEMRQHLHWQAVRKDLQVCAAKWRESSYTRTVLTVPEGYVRDREIRWVLGMHGYGSLPEDFVGQDIQKICDDLDVAFVSVSGRGVVAKNSFEWTGDVEADVAHVFSCIDSTKEQVRLQAGGGVLMGFSQGGQMAMQLLAMHPQRFRGALAMSPGSRHASELSKFLGREDKPTMAGKAVAISWISGEGIGMAQRCRATAAAFEKAGAKAMVQEFPGERHQWPSGYAEYFSTVIQFLE